MPHQTQPIILSEIGTHDNLITKNLLDHKTTKPTLSRGNKAPKLRPALSVITIPTREATHESKCQTHIFISKY